MSGSAEPVAVLNSRRVSPGHYHALELFYLEAQQRMNWLSDCHTTVWVPLAMSNASDG
jgi:hypothetical protein